jgi:hypothetical protein
LLGRAYRFRSSGASSHFRPPDDKAPDAECRHDRLIVGFSLQLDDDRCQFTRRDVADALTEFAVAIRAGAMRRKMLGTVMIESSSSNLIGLPQTLPWKILVV